MPASNNSTTAWHSIMKSYLPPRGHDVDFWWKITGQHLALMIEAAGYPLERQYQILLFHYHWIVPQLGPAPRHDGVPMWKSAVAQDGSPLEYSWKWNTATSTPEVRYSWEPFNFGSNSCLNPLNHSVSREFMRKIKSVVPNVDFSLSRFFLEHLEQGDQLASRLLHAVEYHRTESLDLKSYFLPRKHKPLIGGESSTQSDWDNLISRLDPTNECHHILRDFLANNPQGKIMTPAILAWDNISSAKSRLKWYFMTKHTSFKALREIMTLGGLVAIPEEKLQDLRSLITTIIGLEEEYPEEANYPAAAPMSRTWLDKENLGDCFVYFFDIAARQGGVPQVKFYLPTRTYGPDDLAISQRLVAWMRARDRGEYADSYLRMVNSIAAHRSLENSKGLHSYISYQFSEAGDPDIKSYLTPQIYNRVGLAELSRL